MTIDELIKAFDEMEDWEERCDYLIDMGLDLEPLADEYKTEQNRVHGCQSNVWLISHLTEDENPVLELAAESDAMIVNGLVAVLRTIYHQKTPQEILDADVQTIFSKLGLSQHLSPARRNGLFGMVNRVRELAQQAVNLNS